MIIAQTGDNAAYLSAVAKSGDDALSILQRFGLAGFDCNVTKFKRLNKLGKNVALKPNTTYKMPIQIHQYNGKSIRETLKSEDWQSAKRIEKYNRLMQRNGLRPDDFVVTRELWVPWHELACQGEGVIELSSKPEAPIEKDNTYIDNPEPSSGKGKRIFPIFGPAYQHTPIVSNRLRGKIFYLISGHGGPDSGAQGKRAGNTLCEDEYAYDVTLRLHRLLLSHSATVYLIVRDPNDGIRDAAYLRCDQDEVVWGNKAIPRPQKERLQQRTDLINEIMEKQVKKGRFNQTIIEIHVDSRSRDTKTDVFFYYRPESDESLELAQKIHRTFKNKYQQAQGGRGYEGSVTERYLFTLKETSTRRAVYIELGNIQNDWDQQRLVLNNNRQALANWICQALLKE